ncbi:NADH-quinone oxidoreductase subunit J [Stappia indica]|jgi:NADH:ubiquinone oxidoreductase subunit 6 (subunit J)|uniref:NADH-quinone oxidoreductase subunit J n=1 Tax=Stappia indica TaxID=538381 RepID=UPI001D1932F8|nr:NADH-quinone oxidoreductase subunit J [Stappia indica]MCC4247248.1 NADH-quinone oxidoreductase subunit J [Stappia indica]
MSAQVVFLAAFGLAAVWFGIVVFRTHSMVRSALALLFSQTAIGAMFLVMQAEFLGVLQIMMMATEMSIMAIFMVMFMMDPGGLGEMDMKHQRKLSLGAGIVAFAGAVLVAGLANWGPLPANIPDGSAQVRLLGLELLGRSMLIFESAGLTILTAMIAATAVAVQPARRQEPAMAGTNSGHDGAKAATGHGGHAAHGGALGHDHTGHDTGKYTCPMHPEVVSDEAGNCPKCGMNLVPVEDAERDTHEHGHHHDHSAETARYTCPTHPEVVSDGPGSCPKCGMNLVPAEAPEGAAPAQGHSDKEHRT